MICVGRSPAAEFLADSIAKRLAERELTAISAPRRMGAGWVPEGRRFDVGFWPNHSRGEVSRSEQSPSCQAGSPRCRWIIEQLIRTPVAAPRAVGQHVFELSPAGRVDAAANGRSSRAFHAAGAA